LFEFSFTNRQDAIYTKAELVVDDEGNPKHLPWEDWSDAQTAHPRTSAWVRATAPNGNAAYENRVAWSGELGWGVRPPEPGQTAEDPVPVPAAHDEHDSHDHDSHDHGHDHGGGH
jgi:NADH-quinone oxidoreductase subunit I